MNFLIRRKSPIRQLLKLKNSDSAVVEANTIKTIEKNPAETRQIMPLLINCFGILWLSGFLFVLMKLCYSLIFLKGFKAATGAKLNDEFMLILREVSKVFKFKYIPEIFVSEAVESPVAIGISRISVFIPENLYANMTEDEFKSILFHEFAHIHHKDHLFSILNKFIIGMNWWNPLVYHISTEQNMAREDICDNYAIKGIKSAEVYSNCLVNLAEKICLITNLPATAGMAGRKSGLEKRIKSIMSKERNTITKTRKTVKASIIVMCMLAIGFIGCVSAVEFKKEVENPEKNIKQKQALKKMRSVIVPELHVEKIKMAALIGFLQHSIAIKSGINIVWRGTSTTSGEPISMNVRNMPLLDVIDYACQITKQNYRIAGNTIIIPATPKGKRIESKESIQQKKKNINLLKSKLKNTLVQHVEFDKTHISQVLNFLTHLSRKDNKKGINFFLKSSLPEDSLPRITIKGAEKVSFEDILEIICSNNTYKYRVDPHAVVIIPNITRPISNYQDIRKKLKETMVDSFSIKEMKISKAVRILRKKYGINIFIRLTPQEWKKEPVVNLEQKNKSLYQVIYFLCKAANLKFRIEKYAVVILSGPLPKTKEEIQREKIRMKKLSVLKIKSNALTKKRLKKIIFPKVEFKNANIFTVIRYLNRYSKRNDPDKKGIRVIAGFDMKTAKLLPKITMKFRNISMQETLHYLYNLTALDYKIEEGAVILFFDSNKKIQKKLIFIKTKLFTKPKSNSSLSECELIASPKLIMSPGKEATIRMITERFVYGKKYDIGATMVILASINGDDIDMKGKVTLLYAPKFSNNKAAKAYLMVKKEMLYNVKIKDQSKFSKINFKDEGKFFEIQIKATLVDGEGRPIKK